MSKQILEQRITDFNLDVVIIVRITFLPYAEWGSEANNCVVCRLGENSSFFQFFA